MTPSPHHACPGCGRQLDPIRAGHVAVLGETIAYFCGQQCKQLYVRSHGGRASLEVPTASPPQVAPSVQGTRPAPASAPASSAPKTADSAPVALGTPRLARRDRVLLAADGVAIALGALTLAACAPHFGRDLRLAFSFAAFAALLARVVRAGRDGGDPARVLVVLPPAGALAAECLAVAETDRHAAGIAALAGAGVLAAVAIERAIERTRAPIEAARRSIEQALNVVVRVVHDGKPVERPANDIRPGEQIVVDEGETVGVDGVVVAGEARVRPWLGAKVDSVRREADPIVAGARVTSSRVRITTTWAGGERAWIKLLRHGPARVDVAAPTSRFVRSAVERGAVLAAGLAGFAAFAENATAAEVVAASSAAAMAMGLTGVASFTALQLAHAHLKALVNGITYKDAIAFERAGASDLAVLSARGTVLLGEPEIVAVEVFAGLRHVGDGVAGNAEDPAAEPAPAPAAARILALAAGAAMGSADPLGIAVVRAARARGVRPDPVRNATFRPGLGVTALASTGDRLVVGGRTLMLEEKIGIAVADPHVAAFESEGLSVLLVAVAERVVGLVALRDGLRAGARAAVQMLLDARIEPVLLGGEARDTFEAIGRALDIEHLRPEVLPPDRAAEVRALAGGGAIVALIGHPVLDDASLGAADVAVAMSAAGSAPGEWAIAIAGDDLRDAARALAIPRAAVTRARIAAALGALPGGIALVVIAFGLAPFAVAPLAALMGGLAIAIYAREPAVGAAEG